MCLDGVQQIWRQTVQRLFILTPLPNLTFDKWFVTHFNLVVTKYKDILSLDYLVIFIYYYVLIHVFVNY